MLPARSSAPRRPCAAAHLLAVALAGALVAAPVGAQAPVEPSLGEPSLDGAPDDVPEDLTGSWLGVVGLGSARQARGAGEVPGAVVSREAVLFGAARLATWVRPTWAVEASVSRLNALDDQGVTPVLLGAAWYPRVPDAAARVRPYVSAGVGMVVRRLADDPGYAGQSTGGPARTDAAPGARLGVGLDVFAGRRFVVGGLLGYHVSGALPTPTGRTTTVVTRAAGPAALLTAGVRLPRREP